MPIMTTDWIEPASFASVPTHSQQEHACMPPLQGYDAQMRIAAPSRVKIRDGSTLTIPICARGILPVIDNPQLPRFVAKDTQTGKVYRGVAFNYVRPKLPNVSVDPREGGPRPPKMALPPGMTVETRFTTDMAGVLHLPATPATYEVYIEAEDVKSNMVTIEVEDGKK
ncbi:MULTISPECIES: hypothetical protein [Achromobacter]|uniref:hypothetical protein n=1 Tax=Achromobacter TaxID=222 RepID=UPI001748C18B|nr:MULTISPECIES: hypothetical protein [Achromobacter]